MENRGNFVEVEKANYYFCVGFIPLTNLKIFKRSKLVNIEEIGCIFHAINVFRQVWIPVSIIAVVHSLSKSNKNLINPSVMRNSPYCIGITGTSTSLIGILEHFGHTIVSTNIS